MQAIDWIRPLGRSLMVSALALVSGLAVATAQEAQQPAPQQPAAQQKPQGQGEDIETAAAGDRASRLTLRLKDRDLRDVVASIRKKASVNIIMEPGIESTVSIDLADVHWRQALELVAEQADCVVTELDGGVLKVEKPPRCTFAFENADIGMVIDTIAKISGANIATAPEVKGQISLRLKNIPWRDTLDAAVKTLGFVVVEDRGILRVVPPSKIQQDLVFEAIPLRYVRPSSQYVPFLTSEYVQNRQANIQMQQGGPGGQNRLQFTLLESLQRMITPEIGSLDYDDVQNVLLLKDTRPVVDEIKRIVSQIDIEPAQIYLDVRFVTTTNEDVLDIGISPGGNGYTARLGLGQIPTRLPFDLGAGGWDDSIIANDGGTGPFVDPLGNQSADVTIPNVIYGALDFTQVTATLRLLKKDARSEITQAPKIVALDHQPATIFVGEAVRYAQSRVEQGQAGGLLLALEEGDDSPVNVGFQLLATPHVVPGTDKVILEVIPQRTALTGTGSASAVSPAGFDVFSIGSGGQEGTIALPRVGSSTIATKLLLRSGQTAVLGGLVSETQTETEIKLPLLGDIPVIGYLFKNRQTQDVKSNLIVFITPNLIRSAEDTKRQFEEALRERMQDFGREKDAVFGKDR
jgi:type IV pilus assembly protein PilQ